MAFVHGRQVRTVFNGTPFSGRVNSVGMAWAQALGAATVMTSEGDQFIPGLWSGTLSLGGWFDAEGLAAIRATTGITDGALVSAAPAGYGLGLPVYFAHGNVSGHTVDAAVADTVPFTAEVESSDGPDWGVSLHDLVAVTATADGASVDQLEPSVGGGVGVLQVTAVSGTDPTLDVTIQHSADGSVWADLVTFTQADAATQERITVTGTVNRYLRAIWTAGGTTPSVTFLVAFARR